jgi:hypothetical protein
VNRGDQFRMVLRPVAALAGLIGAVVAVVQGQWLGFAIYLAVCVSFTALTILMVRDLRAQKAKHTPL